MIWIEETAQLRFIDDEGKLLKVVKLVASTVTVHTLSEDCCSSLAPGVLVKLSRVPSRRLAPHSLPR